MNNNIDILIQVGKLSIDQAYDFVNTEQSGGNCLFVGTVRNHSNDRQVTHLDFEAYDGMAKKEMTKLAERAISDYEIDRVAIYHRKGTLQWKEIAVIIAVSAAHRKACFSACEFIIDELKKSVPIWKKEYLDDGSYWVSAHP